MHRVVPVETFLSCPYGVLMSNGYGRVSFMNEAAQVLLGRETMCPLGRPCWEVSRLRTLDGERFCGPNCVVQRRLREKRPRSLDVVTAPPLGALPPRLELLSFFLPDEGLERRAVLHLLLPHREPRGVALADRPSPAAAIGIRHLTPRQKEVLDLLASGMNTREIAATLFVSRTTVRNHVQNTLRTLGVHRRLDAVLAWLQTRRASSGDL